jgi:hypothetical protein
VPVDRAAERRIDDVGGRRIADIERMRRPDRPSVADKIVVLDRDVLLVAAALGLDAVLRVFYDAILDDQSISVGAAVVVIADRRRRAVGVARERSGDRQPVDGQVGEGLVPGVASMSVGW